MPKNHYLALGRMKAGEMNQTEKEFSDYLEDQRREGKIISYQFEAITLKLAPDTRYTPDFVVVNADRTITCYEVKGYWRDDAWVKYKVAAAKYPYLRFVSVMKKPKKLGGGWAFKQVDQDNYEG